MIKERIAAISIISEDLGSYFSKLDGPYVCTPEILVFDYIFDVLHGQV